MTEHRRLLPPGATYYFTVRLEQRGSTMLTDHVNALRFAYAKAVQDFPVICHAMVVLPDHLHAIWTEPSGEVWYCERWRRIKARFTQAVGQLESLRPSHDAKRERGLWQRRFEEHAIRGEDDFRNAVEHCRMNPVKHGLVTDPDHWHYSSFAKARARWPLTEPTPLWRGAPASRHSATVPFAARSLKATGHAPAQSGACPLFSKTDSDPCTIAP